MWGLFTVFCANGKKWPVYRQELPTCCILRCISCCIIDNTGKKYRMAYSHKQIAERYGVSRGAVQGWEKRGLNRGWSMEKIDQWREMHAAGRVVVPPKQQAPPPVVSPDPVKPEAPKPSADDVISAGMGFQETRTLKLRKEIERLSIIIGREKGELVPAVEMRETATRVVSVWCSELDALVGDLPGQLAGLTEAEIQPKLRSRIELLKANAREGFAAL